MKLWLITLCALFTLTGCYDDSSETFQGYIENDLTYISSTVSGRLDSLPVDRGDKIEKGKLLFALEAEPQSDDVLNAQANMEAAFSNVMDLEKGARPETLDQIKAQIQQAKASLNYNQKEYLRRKELLATENIQVDMFDQATRDVETSEALIAQYEASLKESKLPARIDQINAQKAALQAAKASLNKAVWTLAQKSISAPQSGIVFDTYYNLGEEVPANTPVVSLLIPSNTTAITFMPETYLSQLALGNTVTMSCDNCDQGMTGEITFISPTAEYTPPVIYSRENRSKLVYRVEISVGEQLESSLHPGQPIDVTL